MTFKKGYTPWNKGLTGIKTRPKGLPSPFKGKKRKPLGLEIDLPEYRLRYLYQGLGWTQRRIAEYEGCALWTVCERFKRFSIPSRDTKRHVGQETWNKGRHPSPESVDKMRQKLLGRVTWNKGLHFAEYVSPEVRERRKARISETSKSRWADPAYSDRVRRKILASLCGSPNMAEEKLGNLLQQLGLSYKFVGDGTVIIGGLSPDFINTDGKKALIELFGEPWHSQDEIPRRKAIFWKFGFRTLIVWSKELNNIPTLAAKLVEFDRRVAEMAGQHAQAPVQMELIGANKGVM